MFFKAFFVIAAVIAALAFYLLVLRKKPAVATSSNAAPRSSAPTPGPAPTSQPTSGTPTAGAAPINTSPTTAPVAVAVVAASTPTAAPVPVASPAPSAPAPTPSVSDDPYAKMSLRDMLVAYKADYDKLTAMAATLTQRNTERGEIAFKNGVVDPNFKGTIEDLKTPVNDDPNHRLASNFGADIDKLQQGMGGLEIYGLRKQRLAGLVPNTGAEFVKAALSGDYSAIRGA